MGLELMFERRPQGKTMPRRKRIPGQSRGARSISGRASYENLSFGAVLERLSRLGDGGQCIEDLVGGLGHITGCRRVAVIACCLQGVVVGGLVLAESAVDL